MVTLITISLTTSTAGLVDTVTPAVLNVHRLLVLYPGVYPTVVLVTQHILFQALEGRLEHFQPCLCWEESQDSQLFIVSGPKCIIYLNLKNLILLFNTILINI